MNTATPTPETTLPAPAGAEAIATVAATILLEIKALHFNAEKPFIFTSGWASPVYIDCRKIISFPRLRSSLIDFAATTIVRAVTMSAKSRTTGSR